MKRKMSVVLLVLICLGVIVVEGVSQPTPQTSTGFVPPAAPPSPSPLPPAPQVSGSEPAPNFSAVQPQQQDWTFDQLVEALKGVRTRQKELQAQEADLLAKLAKKVEEKRQDLSKSEATLQQLRGETHRMYPEKRFDKTMMKDKMKG